MMSPNRRGPEFLCDSYLSGCLRLFSRSEGSGSQLLETMNPLIAEHFSGSPKFVIVMSGECQGIYPAYSYNRKDN